MRINRRKLRLQAHRPATAQDTIPTHNELVDRGRALGLPAFIGSWPTETLAAKVKKLEAERDHS